MNSIRSAILLLVYSLTLLSAHSYASAVPSTENAEKESVINSTFEHRESSSIKITGKLSVSTRLRSTIEHLANNTYYPGILSDTHNQDKVPVYIMHCVFRL